MNTKQLSVAVGLMILTTACKENDPVQPLNAVSASNSPGQFVPKLVESDSAYDSQPDVVKRKSAPVKGTPKPTEKPVFQVEL